MKQNKIGFYNQNNQTLKSSESMYRIIVFFLFALVSCNVNSQKKKTPQEFINKVVVNSSTYSKDSVAILDDLYLKMKNHEASFTNFDLRSIEPNIITALANCWHLGISLKD